MTIIEIETIEQKYLSWPEYESLIFIDAGSTILL